MLEGSIRTAGTCVLQKERGETRSWTRDGSALTGRTHRLCRTSSVVNALHSYIGMFGYAAHYPDLAM